MNKAITPPLDRPDVETLVERARALVPELRARAPEVDRTRIVAPDMIRKFHDAGFYKITRPSRFGGYDYDFRVLLKVLVELARGCGSSAWTFGNTSSQQINTSMYPMETQEEVWGDDPETLMSGSFAPTGRAERVEGGFRVSGQWGFGSGVDHAQWHLVGAILPSETGGRPELYFLILPRADYEVLDTWDTVGLRGTSSKDVRVESAFVPAHRALPASGVLGGDTPGGRIYGTPMLRMPLLTFAATTFVGPALGMVQEGLDTFVETARVRATRGAVAGGGAKLAEFAAVQSRVAEAAGLLDAAKLLIWRDLDEIFALAEAGGEFSVDLRIRTRLNQALAARFCAQAIEALFANTGGAGLHLDNPLQRLWRDVTAVSRHISLNWDAVSTMYGQQALGLEPRGQY